MKERPILMSEPNILPILEGRKTQTRRIVKPGYHTIGEREDGTLWPWREDCNNADDYWYPCPYACPYGKPGDGLWVRETWRIGAWNENTGCVTVDYLADGHCRKEWIRVEPDEDGDKFNRYWEQSAEDARKAFGWQDSYEWEPGESPCRKRPPMFMPRWASRILLEITDVRVERLQDISEEDAKAEGVSFGNITDQVTGEIDCDAVEAYEELWESINGAGSWDANPWVWVIEFKRIDK